MLEKPQWSKTVTSIQLFMNKNINGYYPIAIGYKRLLPPTIVDVFHSRLKLGDR